MADQPEFSFSAPGDSRGFDHWQDQRQRALSEAAHRFHLPLGHPVEVWLNGGVRLRGLLKTREELLFFDGANLDNTAFTVDGIPFRYAEIESCLRLD